MNSIEVFTDGSCHTQLRIGAWAAIVLIDNEKTVLSGFEQNTTHNRMEIIAVLKALEFLKNKISNVVNVKVISDSQYVVGLTDRREKFERQNFKTKSGTDVQNVDLIKVFINQLDVLKIDFIKIKAHQKKTQIINYNIEADKLCRKLVRERVKLKEKS